MKSYFKLTSSALIFLSNLILLPAWSFGAGEVKPNINGVMSQDGAVQLSISLGAGDVDQGNWFYQVRSFHPGCENPYGNDTTWDTQIESSPLSNTIQIGRRDLGTVYGYNLNQPLTNGCTYLIRVAHWNGFVGEYAETLATPGPTARTLSATSISRGHATLNGEVAANSSITTVSFCYGTNPDLVGCSNIPATTSAQITGTNLQISSTTLTDLSVDQDYYYRVIASGSNGETLGNIRKFRPLSVGIDGLLNSGISTGEYFAIENSLEAYLRLYKSADERVFLAGSRVNDPDLNSCVGKSFVGIIKRILESGQSDTSFASGELAISISGTTSFVGLVQTSNRNIYALGSASRVTQTDSEGGFSCNYSDNKKFLVKLFENGAIDTSFSDDGYLYLDELLKDGSALSMDNGFLSSLTMLGDGTLMITTSERDDFDLLFVNQDGSLETKYGNAGYTKLSRSNLRTFESVQTPSQVVLVGDKSNDSDDWYVRGAISSIDLEGNELETFKGNNKYIYTSGLKEGIYFSPQYRAPFIYILTGVLRSVGNYDLQLFRVNTNGTIDGDYGGYLKDQLQLVGINPVSYGSGEFVVDEYGRILVTIGTDAFVEGRRQSALIRIDDKGHLDQSFGNEGKIWINFDNQAGVFQKSSKEMFIFGTQYSTDTCSLSLKTCGLYRSYLSNFTQYPLLSKPSISIIDKNEDGFTFQIQNFISTQSYNGSSSLGSVIIDGVTGAGQVTGVGPGREVSLSIGTSRNGFGSNSMSISGSTLLSQKQLEEIKKAQELEKRKEAIIKAEAVQAQALQELQNLSNEKPISIETLRNAGISTVIPQVMKEVEVFLSKLDRKERSDVTNLNLRIAEIVREYRFKELERDLTLENLKLVGLRDFNPSSFGEIKMYIDQTQAIQNRDLIKLQDIVDKVNTLERGRENGTLSRADLEKLGVVHTLESKKSQVMLKFRNQPKEIFQNINSVQLAILAIELEIQQRLDKSKAVKEKIRLLREKIQSRKP